MFRDTGVGQVEVDLDFSAVGVMKALLYNFDFDDFAGYKYRPLKPAHTTFLTEKVVPLLANDTGQIWMTGSASRIGTAGWNMTLSQNRVITVAKTLSEQGIDAGQMQTNAIGNTQTAKHSQDDAHDRSVMLWVLPKIHFEPSDKPLPQQVPPKPKVSRHFKIAQMVEVDASLAFKARDFFKKMTKGRIGAGVSFAAMVFIIWDTDNYLACTYIFAAVGAGASLNLPISVGGTTRGPWNDFTTEKPISCSQFGRTARFTTIGGANWSKNWFYMETPPGVSDVQLSLDTGFTAGGGLATYPAHLSAFVPLERPHPFHGP